MSEDKKITIAEMFPDKEDFNNLMDSFDKYQQKADGRDIKKICEKNKEHLSTLGINKDFLPFFLMKKIIDKAIDDADKRNKAVEEVEKMVTDLSGNVVEDISGDVVEDISGDVVEAEFFDVSNNVIEDPSGDVVEDIAGNVVEVKEDISGNFEKDSSNNITLNINNHDKETQTKEEETKTETPDVPEAEHDAEADNNC
jgi:hypothetical protein